MEILPWRAPAFWWRDTPQAAAKILAPAGALYGVVSSHRMARNGLRLPIPVFCVGNFVVGGAGKTPVAIALAKRFVAAGKKAVILSRGYHSAAEHRPPLKVDLMRHRAADVGDEALLLARVAPTIVSADRVDAAHLALRDGANLLILDDGLQNPSLAKDFRLAVVDGATGIGNGHCLPAGPLRAPLSKQLDLVDAVVVLATGAAGEKVADQARALKKPVSYAELTVDAGVGRLLAGQRVYAFAGIGQPSKFYATLAAIGAEIVGTASFPDHHAYRRAELSKLQRAADRQNALLVTTEKDSARFVGGTDLLDAALPAPLAVPVEVRFLDQGFLDDLATAIAAAKF